MCSIHGILISAQNEINITHTDDGGAADKCVPVKLHNYVEHKINCITFSVDVKRII